MLQFARALHGLAQEKCQVTFLKTEIGYSHQIIWTMKIKMNIRTWLVSLTLGPHMKEEEPKVNEQSAEKCRWGPDCPFCKNQEKEKEENKIQQQKMPLQPKVQKPQARRPKTLNLTDRYPSQTKAIQQLGSRDGETKFKVQSQLLLWLRTLFRVRWRRTVQIWTWLRNTHINLSNYYCKTLFSKCNLLILSLRN